MSSTLETVEHPKLTQPRTRVEKGAMNIAASWYIAMPSKDLGKKSITIELFGQPLVAWRDQNDHPVIMGRYCSHMGASLAIGKVVDGCIQCPFHSWRYDSSGQCVSIPEVDHIPSTARQATYVTAERYGYIWVWYGSQTPLFPLPKFSAAEDERHDYMSLRLVEKIKTTGQRVLENTLDYSHIAAVHDMKLSGSIQLTLLNDQHPAQQSELPIQKEAWFGVLCEFTVKGGWGPIVAVGRALGLKMETMMMQIHTWPSGIVFTGFINGEERFKKLFCATPIAENNTKLRTLLMVKKTGKFWLDIPYYVFFGWQHKTGFAQDMPIWNTMKLDGGGVYVKHDWAVLKFRKFYQSWVDKAE